MTVAAATVPGILQTGTHAARPAATTVTQGTLYSCSTHSLVYQSDGATWSTWAALGTGTGTLSDQGIITYLDATVAAAPGTPAAGKLRLYAKTGKVFAVKDDAGAETVMGAGSGTTITTKDEGSTLSATVTTIDFVGAGVTASGGGATTTVTIPGGSGGVAGALFLYSNFR